MARIQNFTGVATRRIVRIVITIDPDDENAATSATVVEEVVASVNGSGVEIARREIDKPVNFFSGSEVAAFKTYINGLTRSLKVTP